MKSSIAQMDSFISSYNSRPDLNVLLHEPALKRAAAQPKELLGRSEATAAVAPGPQLRLQHFAQATFGRLDLAWEAAVQQQQ
jgi:hypothetical protein